jgi:uncharacterized protein YdeI (YjbR/CyaY-like superfamily)
MNLDIQPTFFARQSDFRKWLEQNHDSESELFVGYYKVGSGKPSMTWSESVDQAICFGWIDGIRKSIDADSYFIRFTPRNPKSIWSAVNIKKVETLTAQGLMKAAGIAAYNLRKAHKSGTYTYENKEIKLPEEFEKEFISNEKAWAYFQAMPFSYRKPAIYWVMSARQETTRNKRLDELIRDSEAGRKIKPLSY